MAHVTDALKCYRFMVTLGAATTTDVFNAIAEERRRDLLAAEAALADPLLQPEDELEPGTMPVQGRFADQLACSRTTARASMLRQIGRAHV